MHDPLEQFNLNIYIPIKIGGVDLSLSNAGISMLLVSLIAILVLSLLTRNMKLLPHLPQTMAESLYLFIRSMIDETIGTKGRCLVPFVLSVFVFVLFGNLLGLFPYSFTFTSQLSVVASIAILGSLVSIVLGVYNKGFSWFRIFFPKNLPWLLAPLMIPIEFISFLSKPFSLTMRLVMNMTVGHIMLEVIAGFVFVLGIAGFVPLLFTSVLILFEMFIAVLQAYIFSILTCIYLSEAFNEE